MKKIYLLFFVLCFSGWAAIAQTSGTIPFTYSMSDGDTMTSNTQALPGGFEMVYSIDDPSDSIRANIVWDGSISPSTIGFDIDSSFNAVPNATPGLLSSFLPGGTDSLFKQRVVISNDTAFSPIQLDIATHHALTLNGYKGGSVVGTIAIAAAIQTLTPTDLTSLGTCLDSISIETTNPGYFYHQFTELKIDEFDYMIDNTPPTAVSLLSNSDTTLYLSNILGGGVANIRDTFLADGVDYCGTDSVSSTIDHTYSASNLLLHSGVQWGAENDSVFYHDSVYTNVWDEEGMYDSVMNVITILDTTKPTMACISGIDTIYLAGMLTTDTIDHTYVLDSARDNDEIHALDTVLSKTVFYCSDISVPTTVTVTVTDYSGNASTCTRVVTLLDTTPPEVVISAATDTVVLYLDDNGNAGLGYNNTNGTVCTPPASSTKGALATVVNQDSIDFTAVNNDTCECVYVLGDWDKVYTCQDTGYNTDTLFTVDGHGNKDTALFVVQVLDTTDPVLTVVADLTVSLDSANGENVIRFADLISVATDNNTCYLDTVVYRIGDEANAADTILATCADIVFHDDGTPWEISDTLITRLTDIGGNIVRDTTILTVIDDLAPVLSIANPNVVNLSSVTNDTILLRNLVVDLASDWTGLMTAVDNSQDCEDAQHSIEINFVGDTMWTCANLGLDTLKVVVNDIYGNATDTTLVILDIKDNIAPYIAAFNDTNSVAIDTVIVELDAAGQFILTPAYVLANMVDSLSDNCCFDSTNVWAQSASVSTSPALKGASTSSFPTVVSQDTFDCTDEGNVYLYRVVLKDCSGNIAADSIRVKVVDNMAPTYAGSGITIELHDTIMSYVLTAWDIADMYAGVEDNCSLPASFDTIYQKTFECNDVGVHNVMTRVTDDNGNIGLFTVPITVKDVTPPTVVSKNITVELTQGGAVVVNAGMVKESAWDLCGIDTFYLDAGEYLYTCADTGVHTVHLSVVDIHNNKETVEATVTVVDNSAPVITSAMDTVKVTLDAGVCDSMVVLAVSASDNCSVVLTDDAPATFPIGTTVVAYEAVDPSGNTAVDTVVVVVTAAPNAAPTVEAIADVVVGDTLTSVDAAVVATDGGDCPAQTVTIAAVASGAGVVDTVVEAGGTLTVTLVSGAVGTDTVTVTVGDGVATVTETFTVTVNAVNDAPVVTAPVADVTIYVGGDALNVDISGVFTDPDGDVVTVTPSALPAWMDGTVAGVITGTPAAADAGVTTITLTGADPLGLEAEDVFTVTVLDTSTATAVIDIQDAFEVNMYPNPTRDIVTLDVKKAGLNKVDVSIFTVAGTQVFRQVYSTNLIKVNMANQVSGMYFVKMNIDGDQVIKKLILNRK